MVHILLDGDIFRYRIGFVCEHTRHYVIEKGSEKYGPVAIFSDKSEAEEFIKDDSTLYIKSIRAAERLNKCLHTLKLQLNAILNKFGADKSECTVYLSGKDNFRDTLVDYYKANRDRSKRPLHYKAMTEYLTEHWPTEIIHGIEADDAMGIAQCKDYNEIMGITEETIIVSLDKDMDCIPGWHYNFVNNERYLLDWTDANRTFFYQMIQGDTADNIPGLYKVTGQRAMAKLFEPLSVIEEYEHMWMYVWNMYWYSHLKVKTKCEKEIAKKREDEEDVEDYIDEYPTPESLLPKLHEIGQLLWIWRRDDDRWQLPTETFIDMKVTV